MLLDQYGSSLAVKTDGTLWAWGNNNYGKLGQNKGGNTILSSPVQIPGTTWRRSYRKLDHNSKSKLMEHYGHGDNEQMDN